MEFVSKSLPSTNPLFSLMHHMPMKPWNPYGNRTMIPILSPLCSHFLMQSVSMLSQKRCNKSNQRNQLDNHISRQLADNGLVDSSTMLDTEDRQDIMLDTDESFAFEDDEVIMDASTNVFDVDDSDNLLPFTDRLRGQHTAKEIMSLKLLKLLRLTGAPHYAYTSIIDIFADALASKMVTAGATFRQRDTAIKHFAKRFRLEKLYPTTLTKHMNGRSYPVVLHDAEVMVQLLSKSSLMVEENMLFPDMDNSLPPPLRLRLLPMSTRARYSVLLTVIFVLDPMMFCACS
jgi:hypothetical protein